MHFNSAYAIFLPTIPRFDLGECSHKKRISAINFAEKPV